MTTKNFPLGAIAVVLLGSWLGSLLGSGAARAAETAQIGVPSNGALIFRVNCASCHGVDGRGQGPLSQQLAVPPGDLRDPAFLSSRSNDDLMAVIARGGAALKRSKTMPAFPTIGDLDRWDLVAFLRQNRLKVADFYPSARYFTAKGYLLDKNANERLAALFGRAVPPAEARTTVVTAYGKRAGNDAVGPELVPQDPVSLDKLSPKDKVGYLVFVDLPAQGGEMTSYGVAVAKDGSVTRIASEPGLTKPAFDAPYQVFVGQGQKGQPNSLKPGKAPPAAAQAFKNAYARILESIGLFDKEERDRHWADASGPEFFRYDPRRALPLATAELPGVGGTFRSGAEDFEVEEVPAYLPSGEGEHVYLWVEKRMRSTPEVGRMLALALDAAERDVGYAGLKDRRAVSRQWFSVRSKGTPSPELAGDGFRLIRSSRHGNKLRTGHLLGNRFSLVLRGTHGGPEVAQAILDALADRGLPNWFGPQRFGRDGDNALLGLALVGLGDHRDQARAHRDRFLRRLALSALQSALFNALLEQRLAAGGFAAVELGDLLQLGQDGRGPVFACTDPAADQERFLRFEVSATGPLFGPKMRWPEGEPGRREQELLSRAGLTLEILARGGGELQGGRRPLRVRPTDGQVEVLPDGLRVVFTLPRGAYATALLLELMKAPLGAPE